MSTEWETTLRLNPHADKINIDKVNVIEIKGTTQKIYVKNSMMIDDLPDDNIHLMNTSAPYFDTKMYLKEPIEGDLGNIHNVDKWFEKISKV